MSLTKLNDNLNRVRSLPNKPTLEAEELKAVFDEAANIIKDYINDVLTPEIEVLVQDAIESAKTPIENSLTSTSVAKALSALQGKVLKDLIDVMQSKLNGIQEGANKTTVENVLTSTNITNALSAYQGKVLKDVQNTMKTKLDGIATGANKTTVENVLTSTSTTNALSANQGKVLKGLVDGKQKTITKGTASPSGGSNGDIYIQYF